MGNIFEAQVAKIRTETAYELQQLQRDYHKDRNLIMAKVARELFKLQLRYDRWPMTKQGKAMRNYIIQYKATALDTTPPPVV